MSTIGVLGGRWRASVSGAGTVRPWDGSTDLEWFVAADDRWHVPIEEPSLRQRRLDGAPVIETRIKVPGGDAVHRVWCVADGNGLTIVEIENDSSLPFAVAFNRNDLMSSRPPAEIPIEGIDLPEGSILFPVGHRTTIRFGLAHDPARDPAGVRALPERLPSAAQVARGWRAISDGAGRLTLPDAALIDSIDQLRSELALTGPPSPGDDPVGFLLGVGQAIRLGERADMWTSEVANAVSTVARLTHRWDTAGALDAAAIVLSRSGETRALRDLARLRRSRPAPLPATPPIGGCATTVLAWHEQRLVRCIGVDPGGAGSAELLGTGIPTAWLGANFEVHGLPIGPETTLSYALRWHGDRPAVLWDTEGPNVGLVASIVAPNWSTTEPAGEALWPAPGAGTSGFRQDAPFRLACEVDSAESHR